MNLKLDRHDNTQAVRVDIGAISLYFSYAACIAFDGPRERMANPRYRGYSVTTSKHFNQLGCKAYPDAPSADHFEAALKAALISAAKEA